MRDGLTSLRLERTSCSTGTYTKKQILEARNMPAPVTLKDNAQVLCTLFPEQCKVHMYLTLSWKATPDTTFHVTELIKCICIQHFHSFSIYQAKTNALQKKSINGKINFGKCASCLLFPQKNTILDDAGEKHRQIHMYFFISGVHVYETLQRLLSIDRNVLLIFILPWNSSVDDRILVLSGWQEIRQI